MNNLYICVAIGAQLCGQLVAAQEFFEYAYERARHEWDLDYYENACTFMGLVIYLTQLPTTPIDKIGNHLTVIVALATNIREPQYQHDLYNMLCFAYSIRARLWGYNGIIGNMEINELRTHCIYTEMVLPIAFAEKVLANREKENVEEAKNQLHDLLNLLSSEPVRMVQINNIHWHKTLSFALLANLYRLLNQTQLALECSRTAVQCFAQQIEMQKYCILTWQVRAMRDAAYVHSVYLSQNDIKTDISVLKSIQIGASENGNILPPPFERLFTELKTHYAATNFKLQQEEVQSSITTTTATSIVDD
jgi:hypothetical protein